jgi:hypothetical protein
MKLTLEERKALAAVREPASIYSKPLWQILKRMADRDLCEVAAPMEWQKLDPEKCPLGISVITPAGKRALREEFHRRPDRASRFKRIIEEAQHAYA